ncbi:toprim domain-containing protein [Taibaiella koreensis]|uniref:toprim domain-containing protein n=1 Tax=Taibaiella koreensis TaxID=1268548 RepID=UPI000E5990A6|nr:toprim domain-containing protein [Taibaiella koreensis]
MEKINCAQAKQIDLVDYLAFLGHHPQKTRNQDYWYLSPLREEKTPSFKVNRVKNIWFDHGSGKGGDLLSFGMLYFKCNTSELLYRLLTYQRSKALSFHPPQKPATGLPSSPGFAGEKKEQPDSKILILDTRPLIAKALTDYLDERRIPLAIAHSFCKEVDFLLYNKSYTAIGFQNDTGGYELRSRDFKGSSAPKAITFFDNNSGDVSVFEGFFNYLSFLSMPGHRQDPLSNFLILNSTAFFEKAQALMEQHSRVSLYLDQDKMGIQCTKLALSWDSEKFRDSSQFYRGQKDLNEWLQNQKPPVRINRGYRHHI